MSDYIKSSIAHGLRAGAFCHLGEMDRVRLVKMMARLAEKSYRRGVQHGAVFAGRPTLRGDLASWRFHADLNLSPWADSPNAETSASRLFSEHGVLRDLGFTDEARNDLTTCWVGYTQEQRRMFREAAK